MTLAPGTRVGVYDIDSLLAAVEPAGVPLALTLIDKALSDHGIPGGPVIWCHDEIVLEVPEEAAGKAVELLEEAMTVAFVTIFPCAPTNGLVAAKQGRSWLDTK